MCQQKTKQSLTLSRTIRSILGTSLTENRYCCNRQKLFYSKILYGKHSRQEIANRVSFFGPRNIPRNMRGFYFVFSGLPRIPEYWRVFSADVWTIWLDLSIFMALLLQNLNFIFPRKKPLFFLD